MPDNQPLTQTDLAAFPTAPAANTAYAGYFTGGLIVPMQNVWRTATGYTARRAIVENARCNACHAQLGVGPTFHVGQRNDAPTCAFCHTGNRNNAGTSVNSPVMIHAIHGAAVRTTPYWGGMFAEVEYPGSSCTQCHVPGSFDFANAASVSALPNMLFTYSAATTVSSPISAACSACHDSPTAVQHMQLTGGMVNGLLIGSPQPGNETCLDCHAAGQVADVNVVHRMVP
jgi:OmcA/MtrC family decaheme c-type cytochrome